MAQAAAAAPAAAEGEAAPKKKAGLAMIGAAVGGIVLGTALGALVLAPRIIAKQVAAAGADSTEAAAAGEPALGSAPSKLVNLENIIVNPAGSQGNRFLMTSVAFGVADERLQKRLDESKVELRDRVTGVLESMTLNQLTAPGARDTIKSRIGGVVASMIGPRAEVKVFLPQFVLQ